MSDVIGAIGHAIVDAVLPALGTVIAGMMVVLLKRLLAKQGLELTEKQEDRLKQIVVDKIHATEEAARRGDVTTSEEKKALTVNSATVAAINDPTIPNPSVQKVGQVVDSELNKLRQADATLPGLGKR